MKKQSILSRPTWLLPSRTRLKVPVRFAVKASILLGLVGCASNPNNEVLVDPLKQRLMAREDIALQNLLLSRMGSVDASGSSAAWDAPYYDGPSIEPPLPDLSLLPEDLPPWDESQNIEPITAEAPNPTPPTPEEADSAALPSSSTP